MFFQFAKIDVNGENAIPLYKWLTIETKFEGFGKSPMALMLNGVVKKMDKDYKNNGNVKWNFTTRRKCRMFQNLLGHLLLCRFYMIYFFESML